MSAYESPTIRVSFTKHDVLETAAGFQSVYVNFNDPILDYPNG